MRDDPELNKEQWPADSGYPAGERVSAIDVDEPYRIGIHHVTYDEPLDGVDQCTFYDWTTELSANELVTQLRDETDLPDNPTTEVVMHYNDQDDVYYTSDLASVERNSDFPAACNTMILHYSDDPVNDIAWMQQEADTPVTFHLELYESDAALAADYFDVTDGIPTNNRSGEQTLKELAEIVDDRT